VNERILLVEDDESVRKGVTLLLERAGVRVRGVGDGREALDAFAEQRFDLVLLDVMLPSLDGLEVCREIRRTSNVPIIMLTARTDPTDIVVGLELGADDYVTKPFDPKVLVARVRAGLRRRATQDLEPLIRIRGLEVDPGGFRASLDGQDLNLTAMEFRLLVELARSAGRALSREELLERVWGYDYMGDSRLVDMGVKRLRDKLGDDPRDPTFISTVRRHGYRLERG
jgi:two-component system response regulator MtrA